MILRLLYALFRCDHAAAVRVRLDDGSYVLECPCGNVSELIPRTPKERKQMAKKFPPVQPPTKIKKADVMSFRKAGR